MFYQNLLFYLAACKVNKTDEKGKVNLEPKVSLSFFVFFIRLPPEFLPVLGPVMPTLDAALLCSYRVGADVGHESRLV